MEEKFVKLDAMELNEVRGGAEAGGDCPEAFGEGKPRCCTCRYRNVCPAVNGPA